MAKKQKTRKKPKNGIYDRLWADCPPAGLPAPFDSVAAFSDYRLPPEDPESTCAKLIEDFAVASLQELGVIVRQDGGDWCLCEALTEPKSNLIGCRTAENKPLENVITSHGTLAGKRLPIVATLSDYRIATLASEIGRLYVTGSVVDTALLLSLGLPAITATGLAGMSPTELLELLVELRWTNSLSEENDNQTEAPVELILVNWTLAKLDVNPVSVVDEAARVLARAEASFPHNVRQRVGVWCPSSRATKALREYLGAGAVRKVKFRLVEDSESSSYDIIDFVRGIADATTKNADYVTVVESLHAMAKQNELEFNDQEWAKLSDNYNGLVDEELVRPLVEHSLNQSDPVTRLVGVTLAESCRLLHQDMPLIYRHVSNHAKRGKGKVTELLKLRSNQVNEIIKLAKLLNN